VRFTLRTGWPALQIDKTSALWGFIDRTGKLVIKPQFGMPLWFSEGLVEGYGEENGILNVPLGYVDKSDRYVIRLDEQGMMIEFLVGFSEGLARVSMRPQHDDGSVGPSRWGYLDHTGTWVIPRAFSRAGDFHDGLAAASREDGTWGYIDKTGQFVIAPRFQAATEFSEGLAAVRVGGKWGFIDRTGTVVIAPQFEAVSIFRGGMAGIASGRKIGYVNGAGEVVVPPSLEYGSEFTNGVALVSDSRGYKIIDSSGRMLCRPEEKWAFFQNVDVEKETKQADWMVFAKSLKTRFSPKG